MSFLKKTRKLIVSPRAFFADSRFIKGFYRKKIQGHPPQEDGHIDRAQKKAYYRYGSETEGMLAWEKKWDQSPGKRILFFTFKDFSGSFYKWASAVNRYTPYAVRMVSLAKHKYGYEIDLLYNPKNSDFDFNGISLLIGESDIVHVKDEQYLYLASIGDKSRTRGQVNLDVLKELIKKFSEKPMIFTHYGGYARKFGREFAYREFVLHNFEARIAMTPDLNYEWFNGYFIPHSIDVCSYPYQWHDGKTLMHSPSKAIRKGTGVFNQAVARMGNEIDYDLIQKVSHQECLRRKTQATLFFDQAGREDKNSLGIDDIIGWYGNNALESMVYGIPTIAHISKQAMEGARRAGKDVSQCPIIRVGLDEDSMYQSVRQFFNLAPEQRKELSESTRAWVEIFHSFKTNAHELADIYDQLLKIRSRGQS